MPVQKLPNGKWKWGQSGKEYSDRADAEAQGAAILHSGWKEKSISQSLLNKAIENIQEALVIIRHFEDNKPSAEKDNLAVPASDLDDNGNPVPSDQPSVSTSDGNLTIDGVPTANEFQSTPVDVNLNDVREPANVLGDPDPNKGERNNVDNLHRLSDQLSSDTTK